MRMNTLIRDTVFTSVTCSESAVLNFVDRLPQQHPTTLLQLPVGI